jgi:hypothetical protein
MSASVPVGLCRTYARLDEEFSYSAWQRAIHGERTFLSSGPILEFEVEGAQIGDTLKLTGSGTVHAEARAESIFPLHALQIVQDGEVVASAERNGERSLHLSADVRIRDHSWLVARCGGPGDVDGLRHRDEWQRGIFAHTSPVYVPCGGDWWMFDPTIAQYLITLLEGSLDYIREFPAYMETTRITHAHGEKDHRGYVERPFREAISR